MEQSLSEKVLCPILKRIPHLFNLPKPNTTRKVPAERSAGTELFYGHPPHSGPAFLSSLSRFACSRRTASLRLGLVSGPYDPDLALASVHPRCSRRLSASNYFRLKKALRPRYTAESPSSPQRAGPSGPPLHDFTCAAEMNSALRQGFAVAKRLYAALAAVRKSWAKKQGRLTAALRKDPNYFRLKKALRPRYTAESPSSSSMRSSWLYLATRSVRLGAPVLIWPAFRATAMSAMVASSVSPER